MRPSRIQAVNHVEIEASSGLDEELRWFYGEVARLKEVYGEQAGRRQLRFRSEEIELRIVLAEKPRIDPVAYRVTIAVPSLWEAAETLRERSVPYEYLTGFLYTDRRLGTRDPAGNRVLLKQVWPEGPF